MSIDNAGVREALSVQAQKIVVLSEDDAALDFGQRKVAAVAFTC